MQVVQWLIVVLFPLMIVSLIVWAIKNRPYAPPSDLRRADDEPVVDPILRAESMERFWGPK